jgi:hypothetical protein
MSVSPSDPASRPVPGSITRASPARVRVPGYAFFSVTENLPKNIVSNSRSVVTASM